MSGTVTVCPGSSQRNGRKPRVFGNRDSRDMPGRTGTCPNGKASEYRDGPGHTPLRGVPLSRPDAGGDYLGQRSAAQNNTVGTHNQRALRLIASRCWRRSSFVVVARLLATQMAIKSPMTIATCMANPSNCMAETSRNAPFPEANSCFLYVSRVLTRSTRQRGRGAAIPQSTQKILRGIPTHG